MCTGCTLCFRNCPVGAITGEKKMPHYINQSLCIKCGVCYDKCKFKAISIV
jgi:NADP-reducing hydrogenase subunit HndC